MTLRASAAGLLTAILILDCGPGLQATEEAQPTLFTMPGTEVHALTSNYNDVNYELRVWLPDGYNKSAKQYGLTVLLDADYQFPLAVSILEHLADREQADDSIVVAIAYKDSARNPEGYRRNRTRDYTPTHVAEGGYGPEYQRYSGGAPAFLKFVSSEMMPFLEARYRLLTGQRTLVGHSFGGLFGAYVLSESAGLFNSYILISPSLWYDERLMIKTASEGLTGDPDAYTRMYLAVGGHENQSGHPMVDELQMYASALRGQEQTGLEITVRVFDGETHASVYPIALSAALRHLRSR